MFDLTGTTAVVTGAAGAIGRAIVQRLHQAGSDVWSLDLACEMSDRSIVCDVSDANAFHAALASVKQRAGRVDIIVGNAGVQPLGPLLQETHIDALRATLAVNTEPAIVATRFAAEHMQPGGRLIHIASFIGMSPGRGASAYGLSKSALVYLARLGAIELAERGITVNAVCPGTIDTPAVEPVERDWVARTCPMRRLGTPEEVAASVHYLASQESAYLTGQAIVIDGGSTAGLLSHEVAVATAFQGDWWQKQGGA